MLETIARRLSDDVWIAAPMEVQSGAGHSLTLARPARPRRLDERRFCVGGTPKDSVMMATTEIMNDHRPDLVLSGVNRGANLGEDFTYSGTVSAAMKGALAGIPSIALPQAYARQGMASGTVQLSERTIIAAEAGRPLAALSRGLCVRIYRAGRADGFWEPELASLR